MKKILCIGGAGYVGSKINEVLNSKYNIHNVDLNWFVKTFPALQTWLAKLKDNPLFLTTMTKYEVWKEESPKIIVKW